MLHVGPTELLHTHVVRLLFLVRLTWSENACERILPSRFAYSAARTAVRLTLSPLLVSVLSSLCAGGCGWRCGAAASTGRGCSVRRGRPSTERRERQLPQLLHRRRARTQNVRNTQPQHAAQRGTARTLLTVLSYAVSVLSMRSGPTTVLVLSLAFIGAVVMLHIFGKLAK